MADNNIVVPHPDPTVLTTAQLAVAITALREFLLSKVEALEKEVDAAEGARTAIIQRLETGTHHLRELQETQFRSVQGQIDQTATENKSALGAALSASKEALREAAAAFTERINNLTALFNEQIRSIQTQFVSKDVAVAAALQAAKEAVAEQNRSNAAAIDKSERAVSEQIKQLNELIRTSNGLINTQQGTLEVRLTRLEEWRVVAAIATREQTVDKKDVQASNLVIIGLIASIILGGAGLFIAINKQEAIRPTETVYVPSAPGMPPVTASPTPGVSQ